MAPAAYAVWAFVLAKVSGPRTMTVRPNEDGDADILQDEKVFSPSMQISSVHVAVNDKLFRVYFDKHLHITNSEDRIYIFLRLRTKTEAVSININNNLPDIVNIFCR